MTKLSVFTYKFPYQNYIEKKQQQNWISLFLIIKKNLLFSMKSKKLYFIKKIYFSLHFSS